MTPQIGIKCKTCNSVYPESDMYYCPKCGKPDQPTPLNNTLEIFYNYEDIANKVRKSDIATRVNGIWRFREILPINNLDNVVTLGEGSTPLRRCRRLEEHFGIKEIYVKDESVNPTSCHKDREASVLISKAREWDRGTIAAFTCGNLGASVAAYSAKGGLKCVILIPYADIYPVPRIAQMTAFGANLYEISGAESELVELARTLHDQYGWVFPILGGGVRWEGKPQTPYVHEGKKTIALEIVQQLGWRYPDHLISCGSGGNFYDSWKGFLEVKKLNWVQGDLPKMHSAESATANPTYRAFTEQKEYVILEKTERTVAYPISSAVSPLKSLSALKESNGSPLSLTDGQLLEAQRLLARKEGVFVEPASATSIAALTELAREGSIDKDQSVVCIVTASGLKYPDVIVDNAPKIPAIRANAESLRKLTLI